MERCVALIPRRVRHGMENEEWGMEMEMEWTRTWTCNTCDELLFTTGNLYLGLVVMYLVCCFVVLGLTFPWMHEVLG